ncbi:MAG TPA: hypothetical protein VJR48_00430 [Ktedonobacterales bacterium]|nr:hypothetical protein [Ktedonobacterales bacterium]
MRLLRRAGGIVLVLLALLLGMVGCRLSQQHAPASQFALAS